MKKTTTKSWQVLLLDPKGRVLGGRRVEAPVWLEAVQSFAGERGEPLGNGGLVCSIQPDGSFLVFESQVSRVFHARPASPVLPDGTVPQGRTSTVRGMGAFGAEPVSGQTGPVMPAVPPPKRSGSVELDPPEARPDKDEPPVVVDPEMMAEVTRLERMARWSEVKGGEGDELLPHRVLWCKKQQDKEGEEIRCALAVWPDSPRTPLEQLILTHLSGLIEQLALRPEQACLVVAAFDHAFHQVPIRPPLAAAVWGGSYGDVPSVRWAGEAASTWPEIAPSGAGLGFRTPGDSGTVMVPAVRLGGAQPESSPLASPPAKEAQIPTAMVARSEADRGKGKKREVRAPDTPTAPEIPSRRSGPRTESLLFMAFDALNPIYECETWSESVSVVLGALTKLLPAEAAAVYLYDESTGAMRLEALRSSGKPPQSDIHVAMGQGLLGACAGQSVPLALTEVGRDSRFGSVLASALEIRPASLLGAPVEHQDRLFGAVELINRTGRPGFSGGEVEAAAYAGRMLGERLSVLPRSKSDVDDGDLE
jgi:hypothetical protein